tara:strand:- start:105094 stop:105675 length:582 start_codon:yes stop_codon:yes gene_type:complete
MQLSHVLGAGVLIAAIGYSLRSNADANNRHVIDPNSPAAASSSAASSSAPTLAPVPSTPLAPPVADGHYVLVVEGDRNAVSVTFARKKAARWGGVPKGFDSTWRVSIRDGGGKELANVPLDVRPFATDAQSVGKGPRVHGCVVIESKIGLLLNVPAFAEAASYEFFRTESDAVKVALGTMTGAAIRELAGGGR